jgi:hypothetical protein
MKGFGNFLDRKGRETKRQLEVLQRVLQKEGLTVEAFLEDEDPYLFVRAKDNGVSFDGVRVYRIGNNYAYRVQKEEKTHPYGKAYPLDVEGMFQDLMADEGMNEESAGKEIIKALNNEFTKFFEKSSEAEKEARAGEFNQSADPAGKMTVNTYGTDFSNMVGSNLRDNG